MRIVVTAGPTREYIDAVRFLTNASSGRMGVAVAEAAAAAGHEVVLLAGPGVAAPAAGCAVERFVTVADLKGLLARHFPACDALVMAAAVGDFRPERTLPEKVSRKAGPITLRLVPTEDLLAGLRGQKRPAQRVVAFAVEDAPAPKAEAKALAEMAEKGADYVVVNTPAAMGAEDSSACVLAAGSGAVLPWASRPKRRLAEQLVRLLAGP